MCYEGQGVREGTRPHCRWVSSEKEKEEEEDDIDDRPTTTATGGARGIKREDDLRWRRGSRQCRCGCVD